MRHRVKISPQAKVMLKELAGRLGMPSISMSGMTEICIQSLYEKVILGEAFNDEINPFLKRLDEIKTMLQEILPEV